MVSEIPSANPRILALDMFNSSSLKLANNTYADLADALVTFRASCAVDCEGLRALDSTRDSARAGRITSIGITAGFTNTSGGNLCSSCEHKFPTTV
jgi:hypothetical protein